MFGSGGSAAGTIEYPEYIRIIHGGMLAHYLASDDQDGFVYSMTDLINAAIATESPYTDGDRPSGAIAYDPDVDIDELDVQYAKLQAAADSVGSDVWSTYLSSVLAKADDGSTFPAIDFLSNITTAMDSAVTACLDALIQEPIDDAVDAYSSSQESQFLKSVSRFTSGMADINAVQSSSFAMGLAILESDYNADVARFASNLKVETFRNLLIPTIQAHVQAELNRAGYRDTFVTAGVSALMDLLKLKVSSLTSASGLLSALKQLVITSKQYQQAYNLEVDVREATYDIDLYQHMGNLLAAAPGGVGSSARESMFSKTMGAMGDIAVTAATVAKIAAL